MIGANKMDYKPTKSSSFSEQVFYPIGSGIDGSGTGFGNTGSYKLCYGFEEGDGCGTGHVGGNRWFNPVSGEPIGAGFDCNYPDGSGEGFDSALYKSGSGSGRGEFEYFSDHEGFGDGAGTVSQNRSRRS